MTVKSILDIDVNDTRFREFKRLYDQYNLALRSAPAAWKLVNTQIDGSRASFDKLVDKMAAANVQAGLAAKAQERADDMTRRTSERWASIARSTMSFASSIRDATTSVIKMAGITGIITGLVGAGGLWGIDRMAMSAAGTRRSSMGLGLGFGEQRAFSSNFARLVDPEAFLSGVAGAKMDVTRRVGLLGAGLSPTELAGDTAQTAVALLRRLKQIADTTNPAMFAQIIQARRLDQFVSPEDLQRLRATSPAEFEQLARRFGTTQTTADVPTATAKAWQDFTTQLSNAGNSIEATFIKGLAPLAPGLSKLSEGVESVIRAFLNSPTLEKWITMLDQGLEKLAGYIGTDEFAQKVDGFVKGVGEMAAAIADFLPSIKTTVNVGKAAAGVGRGLYGGLVTVPTAAAGGLLGGARDKLLEYNDWMQRHFGRPISIDEAMQIIRQREGSGDSAVSPKGAIGRYQVTPGTARQYGFDPSRLMDPAYNEQAARAIVTDLARRYHGNLSEVMAAYNAGPGRADIFRNSGDSPNVLPRETQRYIAGTREVTIRVDNNTGGNAAVSVNALKN
jgi:Transglycosylase SLT domain